MAKDSKGRTAFVSGEPTIANPAGNADPKRSVEPKEAQFKRLAGKRVPRAIKAILAVGKLGSRRPTRDRVDRIEAALVRALDQCIADLRRANVSAPMLFDVDKE